MKKIIFFGILLTLTSFSFSQDLIVTEKGDSIKCKINRVDRDFIEYTMNDGNGTKTTAISMVQIESYKRNYFNTISKGKDSKGALSSGHIQKLKKLRLNASAGWSYMTGNISGDIPPFLEEHLKQLKTGGNFGLEADFFFNESWGIGLMYNWFGTSNEVNNVLFVDSAGNSQRGSIRDDISINYFGPQVTYRIVTNDNKTFFNFVFSLGYLGYKNEAIFLENIMLESETVGAVYGLGAEFMIDEKIALGINIDYKMGFLSYFDVTSGGRNQRITLEPNSLEDVSHININASLSFYLL